MAWGAKAWSPKQAVFAGLVGAFANAGAVRLAEVAGLQTGTGGFARWLLTHARTWLGGWVPASLGPLGLELFHAGVGIVSALLYGSLFERWLPGRPWLRGLLYAQLMWGVQALVVLPWLGYGYFGVALSPLTPVWSWTLNALYGIVLGVVYAAR